MTGTGLGAILFGPSVVSILGIIVLIFQAVLLAHGGLTSLGANAFSSGCAYTSSPITINTVSIPSITASGSCVKPAVLHSDRNRRGCDCVLYGADGGAEKVDR